MLDLMPVRLVEDDEFELDFIAAVAQAAPAGREPSLYELIDDPIAALLRRRDGISADEVWQVVADRRRENRPPQKSSSR